MKFLNTMRDVRNLFFIGLGTKRVNRILFCGFVIAVIWCFADFRSGSLTVNYIDDIICLGMGIVVERLIPWGKPQIVEAATPESRK